MVTRTFPLVYSLYHKSAGHKDLEFASSLSWLILFW
jgi:hypothetical protein